MIHSDSSKVRMHDVTRRRAMKQALASSCGTACDVHRFQIPALCTSTHATRTAQQTAYLAACTPYRSNRSRKISVDDTRCARCCLRRKRERERQRWVYRERLRQEPSRLTALSPCTDCTGAHPQVQTKASDRSLSRHVSHPRKRAPVEVPSLLLFSRRCRICWRSTGVDCVCLRKVRMENHVPLIFVS